MRKFALTCIFISCNFVLSACQEAVKPDEGPWPNGHSINQALNFSALDSTDAFDRHTLVHNGEPLGVFLHMKPGPQPRIVTFPHEGISVQQAMNTTDALIVLGSGFVSEAHSLEPVGLLRVNDVQLSPLAPYGYTRIVGINDSEAGVVHRSAYERNMFVSALQAGPGIIEQGALDISERDLERPRYYRSFLALCTDGFSVGISTQPTNLHTLGQALVNLFAQEQLDCPEVVNLAGDRQAVLAVRSSDGEGYFFHGDIITNKVTLFSFER